MEPSISKLGTLGHNSSGLPTTAKVSPAFLCGGDSHSAQAKSLGNSPCTVHLVWHKAEPQVPWTVSVLKSSEGGTAHVVSIPLSLVQISISPGIVFLLPEVFALPSRSRGQVNSCVSKSSFPLYFVMSLSGDEVNSYRST